MRFFQMINYRLLLFTLLIGIVPTIIVGLLLYSNAKNEITSKTHETIAAHSFTVGMRLEDYFETREHQAYVIANTPVVIESVREFVNNQWRYNHPLWQENIAILDQFAEVVISSYDLNSVFITDKDGILIYDLSTESPVPLGLNLPERSDYFNNALQSVKDGEIAWLEQNYSPVSQSINLILSTPLFASGNSGEVIGSLNMGMGHTDVDRLVHRGVGEIGLTANAYLIDEQGILRCTPYFESSSSMVPLQTQLETEAVHMLRSLQHVDLEQSYDTSEYIDYRGEMVLGNVTKTRLGSTPVGLVVEIQDEEVYVGLLKLRNNLIYILLSFFCLILIISYLISNSIAGPIRDIQSWAQDLTSGNYYTKKPASSLIEIKDLSTTLNKMVEEIEGREVALAQKKDEIEANFNQLLASNEEIATLNEKLEYQANHDFITGLPNRRNFIEKLELELLDNKQGLVALVDLDNFKEINDTLGHMFGDKLLSAIGRRLLSVCRDNNIFIARYGGDEFLFLLENHSNIALLEEKLLLVKNTLEQPYKVEDRQMNIRCSMGVVSYPTDASKTNDLITYADVAMYRAKDSGSKRWKFYNEQMVFLLKEKMRIKNILEKALIDNEFELLFQPQVELQTGAISCFEALLRLKKHNDISPEYFIPVAEESGLIIDIGRWVTKASIEKISSWQQQGIVPKRISINFSSKQLEDRTFVEFVAAQLENSQVSANLLEIEITESVLFQETGQSMQLLSGLEKLGVTIALDDFGSGYSSLSYLTYINLNKVKLDRAFCYKFLTEQHQETMKNLMALFHSMGLLIVAEGIESDEHCRALKNFNCDLVQGYIFSKPVAAEKAETMFKYKFPV